METHNSLRRITRRSNVLTGNSPISISQSQHDSENETEILSSSYSEDVFTNSRVTTSTKQRKSKSLRHNTSDYSSEENDESGFYKRSSSNRNGKVVHSTEDLSSHKPYKLYKEAGEYWNKYPKTDYTYSRYSPHRRELEPGAIVMPNMSRRSIHSEERNVSNSKNNDVLERTYLSRNYHYSHSDLPKRRLEQFWGKDEVDTINKTFIQRFLEITRITLIYTMIMNYFHSFVHRRLFNKSYVGNYRTQKKWYQKIWTTISHTFAKIGSAYYTLLGSVLLLDSWLLRRENRTTQSSDESTQNYVNQVSEDRWKILRRLGYAFLIILLLLLGINYGTNIDLDEYIPEMPDLPKLPELPSSISIINPISEYVQSPQDAFMETFEYIKLATNERYNELYNFFLSEYLSLNKDEQFNQVEQSNTLPEQSNILIQSPPSEDLLIDDNNNNNAIHDHFELFNDENIEL